jgi:hypothetical protein
MLGDVEVSYFGDFVVEEDVGRFNIPVNDIRLVQFVQSFQNIIGHLPYVFLRNSLFDGQGFLDAVLNIMLTTCRSPSLANSITMHSISDFSS